MAMGGSGSFFTHVRPDSASFTGAAAGKPWSGDSNPPPTAHRRLAKTVRALRGALTLYHIFFYSSFISSFVNACVSVISVLASICD